MKPERILASQRRIERVNDNFLKEQHYKEGQLKNRTLLELIPGGPAHRHRTDAFAPPAYLQRAGRPSEPEQLREHDCLLLRIAIDRRFLRWGFAREGVHFDAQVRTSMSSNDIDALAQCAAAGGGITRLASFIADPYLARGELVELFSSATPTHSRATSAPLDYYLCVRNRYELTPKVRLFMNYLQHALPNELQPRNTGTWHESVDSANG